MARRFARRKPRVLWLPVLGNDVSSIQDEDNWVNGTQGSLTLPTGANSGRIIFDAVPVTFDYSDPPSVEQGQFTKTLQDLASGNNYRLRRIVGKCFVSAYTQATDFTYMPPIDVCAGFIINKTDDSGNLVFANNPQDAAPLASDASQDPWIWRRRWLLSPTPAWFSGVQAGNMYSFNGTGQYPQTNATYGSVADGPHIDQKTARVIGNQERLFFWISARTHTTTTTNEVSLAWTLDVRILASLRMNQGNRRNASR